MESQSSFEGWAIVEVMGHNTFVGFVKTEVYGSAVMFRIDVPSRPAREETLAVARTIGWETVPAGSRVSVDHRPGFTKLIGAGSIYAISPCTETAAMEALERLDRRPLQLIDLPAMGQIEGDNGERPAEAVQADDDGDPF